MITPLSYAIKGIADDKILIEVVKILLKFGAEVNDLPYLVYTCQAGQYSTFDILYEAGADINAFIDVQGPSVMDSLSVVAHAGNLEMVKRLISLGATRVDTAMIWACYNGSKNVIEYFLEKGIDADLKFNDIYSGAPLVYSIADQSGETTRILLEAGADITLKNDIYRNHVYLACELSNVNSAKLLIDAGMEIPRDALACAYEKSDFEMVRLFLKNGVRPRIESRPIHHWFTMGGQQDLLSFLVENGYNIDESCKFSETSLHIAVIRKNKDMTRFLLSLGANPNAKDCCGETPLHFAAKEDLCDIARILVESGANVLAENNFGKTVEDLTHKYKRGRTRKYLKSVEMKNACER